MAANRTAAEDLRRAVISRPASGPAGLQGRTARGGLAESRGHRRHAGAEHRRVAPRTRRIRRAPHRHGAAPRLSIRGFGSAARPAQGAQLASASISLEIRNPGAARGGSHARWCLWLVPKFRDAADPDVAQAAKPAIAVLPFQNQGDDPAREYLADGLTQDIINSLGRFSALTVMSWNAVAPTKATAVRPGEIARVLAVRYQVEGSVRYAGDAGAHQLRRWSTSQGRVLWSARFDEAPIDVFALQDRITREIAGALAIRVTAVRAAARRDEADRELRRLRLPAARAAGAAAPVARRHRRGAGTVAPRHRARPELRRRAFGAGRNLPRGDFDGLGASRPTNTGNASRTHASEALQLDASDVRARILLARTLHRLQPLSRSADAQIDRAIAINPNDAGRARRARQHPGVAGQDRRGHRVPRAGAAHRSRAQRLRPLRAERWRTT